MQEVKSGSIWTLVKSCRLSLEYEQGGVKPSTRSPTLWKNSVPAQMSDLLTFPTRCWWPVHHAQLPICVSNPEGAKEPRFVILDKQKSAVHQGLVVFKAVEGLDGCHSALTQMRSLHISDTRWQSWTRKNKWSEMMTSCIACVCPPAWIYYVLSQPVWRGEWHADGVTFNYNPAAGQMGLGISSS